MNTMLFAPQKSDAITFPAEETTFAFFGGGEPGRFNCIDCLLVSSSKQWRGWSGGAMVLGKLPVPGRPTIWITVGQGPIALAVGAGGGGLDIFTLIYPFSSFSLSLGDGPI